MYFANILLFVFSASRALAAAPVKSSSTPTAAMTTSYEMSASISLISSKYTDTTTDPVSTFATIISSEYASVHKKFVPAPSLSLAITRSTSTRSSTRSFSNTSLCSFTTSSDTKYKSKFKSTKSTTLDSVTNDSDVVESTATMFAPTSSTGIEFTVPMASLLRNFYQKAIRIPEMPSRLKDLKAHQNTATTNSTYHTRGSSTFDKYSASVVVDAVSITEPPILTGKPTIKPRSTPTNLPPFYASLTKPKNTNSITTSPEYSMYVSSTKGKHHKTSQTSAAAEATSTYSGVYSNGDPESDIYGDEYRDGLNQGEIFGLETQCDDPRYDQGSIKIYHDSRLGLNDPQESNYLFQGLMLDGFNVMLSPEPLLTVKYDDNQVVYLNDSLFNPYAIFRANGWYLDTMGGRAAICPSQDSALAYIPDGEEPQCQDAVEVYLRIVPLPEIDE